MKPIPLATNRFPRFYRGGSAIDELRGGAPGAGGAFLPEDWVGSTTAAFGSAATASRSVRPSSSRVSPSPSVPKAAVVDPTQSSGRNPPPAPGVVPRSSSMADPPR